MQTLVRDSADGRKFTSLLEEVYDLSMKYYTILLNIKYFYNKYRKIFLSEKVMLF